MFRAVVDPSWSLAQWRGAARRALSADVAPEAVEWSNEPGGLLPGIALPEAAGDARSLVPVALLPFAEQVLQHRDPARHALLYRIAWRMRHGEPTLLGRSTDSDMFTLHDMAKAVRRDRHKMKAFVRFREIATDAGPHFVAWFEPDHFIVDAIAPFFVRRFTGMRWSILTPYRSAFWDREELRFGPGAGKSDAPGEDLLEEVWRSYYASTFNPARINPKMMRQEMAQKYWKNLPEATLIPGLLQQAAGRVQAMADRAPEPPRRRIPAAPAKIETARDGDDLAAVRARAADCRACPLWEPATQTVFGEGPADARVMVVGEVPGDAEDLSGRPFVGPAGKLFDRALAEIGVDRAHLYVTNAVKHFKFEQRGKVRLHKTPDTSERRACRQWLEREIAQVAPQVIVCLGATAAQAVFGSSFRLMRERGAWRALAGGARGFATVHPSWVLRQQGPQSGGDAAYAGFRDDLRLLLDLATP